MPYKDQLEGSRRAASFAVIKMYWPTGVADAIVMRSVDLPEVAKLESSHFE
jgi:hypothetical protein